VSLTGGNRNDVTQLIPLINAVPPVRGRRGRPRRRPEAIYADRGSLCGVSPVPASSGKTRRHRLNRGGDRQANRALYVIVITRMRHDTDIRAYLQRRTAEGLSKKEIIRCLKRYVARELYKILTSPKTRNQDLTPAA
jgi:transposase